MIKKAAGLLFTSLQLTKQIHPNADKQIKEIIGDIIQRLDSNLTSISKNRYNDEYITSFDSFLTTDFIYLVSGKNLFFAHNLLTKNQPLKAHKLDFLLYR